MKRVLLPAVAACLLAGCIGDLPEEQFTCLIAADLYDQYNEAYVFSPQGEQKRLAMEKSLQAERECVSAESRARPAPDGR